MKAFLLAAGIGSRLKPLTDRVPKCLLPIHAKPLLQIWLELLDRYRIDEVLINIHHHPAAVDAFIARIRPALRIEITPFYEKSLLGSAGTLAANRSFVEDCDDFLIAYADNLTCINLADMAAFHRRVQAKGAILTMGLMPTSNPGECGIAATNAEGRIIHFIEKPQKPLGNLANGGIYIATPELFGYIPEARGAPVDLGFDVLPALVGKMFGYRIKEYLRDIGSPEHYQKALVEWPQQSLCSGEA